LAGCAGRRDSLPFPAARGAGRLQHEEPGVARHRAPPAARRARRFRRARLRSRSRAGAAALVAQELDRLLRPERRRLEVDLELDPEARAPLRAPAPAPGHPEEVAERGVRATEDVAEGLEDVLETRALVVALRLAPQPFVSELIVERTLLLIRQDVVGFRDRLELRLGVLVVRVPVGMVLERELPVRRADVVRRGLSIDAQQFVVVA